MELLILYTVLFSGAIIGFIWLYFDNKKRAKVKD